MLTQVGTGFDPGINSSSQRAFETVPIVERSSTEFLRRNFLNDRPNQADEREGSRNAWPIPRSSCISTVLSIKLGGPSFVRRYNGVVIDHLGNAFRMLIALFALLACSHPLRAQTSTPVPSPLTPGDFSPQRQSDIRVQIGDQIGDQIPADPPDTRSTFQNKGSQDKSPSPSTPAANQGPQRLVLLEGGRLSVIGHFQAGINAISEGNVYWNLAEFAAPDVDFDSDPEWLEAYLKPGISFERTGVNGPSSYGKLSSVISGTLEIDAFDQGNTGRITLEEGYLGFRTQPIGSTRSWDVSFGPRELRLGTGMLIANGGQNGFERGALKFGPRKAWEFAAIGKRRRKERTTTLYYLDANELASNDTGTTLAGVDFRIDRPSGNFIGTTYIYVPTSDSPYPKAAPGGIGPPTILPGAREGLHSVSTYLRTNPLPTIPEVFVTADFAYQRNDRINLEAWGGRFQAGRTLTGLPWRPQLTYSFQSFSGDDPQTTRLERFDPLFYEGSPSSWSTGSKSALVFINSNVNSHQLTLALQPTPKDTVTLRYAHIRANELRSPLQFGQATRVELENGLSTVIAGVTAPDVSDDFFIEYNRIINEHKFLNAGFSLSVPGEGIELVAPGNTPVWPGGFLNLVINY